MNQRVLVSGLCLTWAVVFTPALAAVQVTEIGGGQYRATFRHAAPAGTRSAHLAGSFNGWNPQALPMQREGDAGVFTCALTLTAGRYEYKFVLDGEHWRTDLENPNCTDGYQNSLVFAGVTAETAQLPKPAPDVRAAEGAHPAVVAGWLERLSRAPEESRRALAQAMFRELPMPHVTEETVTFLWMGDQALAASVYVFAGGARWDYALKPVTGAPGLRALSLDRRAFPQRWGYVYAITGGSEVIIQLDPHGWSVTSRAERPATRGIAGSAQTGRIELLPHLDTGSANLQPRDIYVYLPPGYGRTDARYPVLYMHDGQNCWDDPVNPFGHGGWTVNLIADRLIHAGETQPFIVVAVANTAERMREYGPGANILSDNAHPYIQFLKNQVKPYVDAHYRTKPDPASTHLAGSSMGGAISLQAALLNPGYFGGAACLSPALMVRDSFGRGYLDLLRETGKCDVQLYIDNGTAGPGADGRETTRALVAELRSAGWANDVDLMYFEDEGAAHNESAWCARFDRALRFLFR